jgi:diguanylate cyclase (GGDEF)-like protein
VTDEDAAQRQLAQREAYARSILDSMDTPTAVVDADGIIRAVNRAWMRVSEAAPIPTALGTGADYGEVCRRSAAAGCEDAGRALDALTAVLAGRSESVTVAYELDGPPRSWWEIRITPLASVEGGAVLVHTDVSARHQLEQLLREEARHDPLTRLHNRAGLAERHELSAARARRTGRPLTLLLLDLDAFKPINDRFGHHVGDEVLRRFADHLRAHTREVDTVARLGGDEFVVLCEDLSASDAAALARRVRRAELPLLDGTLTSVEASVGTVQVDATVPLEQALVAADRRMYRAKTASRAG